MAKKGVWKGYIFDTEDEFKNFMRFYRDTGIDEVGGNTYAQLNEYGASSVFGAAGNVDAIREKGRALFWMAERANRSTAAGIAWDILKQQDKIKFGTAQFKENFVRLTNDYSLSMMNSSAAGFQRGLASIPTQFWAYSFRMMEAMVGSKFTGAQKARLLLANTLMAGTAGVPMGFLLESFWENYNKGPTDIKKWDGWVERGVFDGLAYLVTGADVRIGDKVGTADLIPNAIMDLFNAGQYGEKSTAQVLMGATGSKIGEALPVLGDAIKYTTISMNGSGEGVEGLATESWLNLAKQLQTVNFAHNAYIAAQYGMYKTKAGTVVATDLPEADAFFFALGFQPGQSDEASYFIDAMKDDDVDDYARLINNWRQEGMTNGDKLKENAEKEYGLLHLLPASERIKILRKAQRIPDKSLYDSVVKRYNKDAVHSEFQDTIDQNRNETNGE
jgi:hypothetical protein